MTKLTKKEIVFLMKILNQNVSVSGIADMAAITNLYQKMGMMAEELSDVDNNPKKEGEK